MRPPVCKAPNKNAPSTVPCGVALPRSATVIASNPKVPATSAVNAYSVPRVCKAPPRPARPPQINIVAVVTNGIEIPADLAAFEFAPTALNLNPKVLLLINHHTSTATNNAIIIPR